jgi:hypothetical protein
MSDAHNAPTSALSSPTHRPLYSANTALNFSAQQAEVRLSSPLVLHGEERVIERFIPFCLMQNEPINAEEMVSKQ